MNAPPFDPDLDLIVENEGIRHPMRQFAIIAAAICVGIVVAVLLLGHIH
jgi:hypothetical protein